MWLATAFFLEEKQGQGENNFEALINRMAKVEKAMKKIIPTIPTIEKWIKSYNSKSEKTNN